MDRVNLEQNDYRSRVAESLSNIFNKEYYADVTLATEDNQQIKAHKAHKALSEE